MLLRAPCDRDAESVATLLAARDTADFGRPDYTLGDLLDDWRSSELDLARDAIVAQAADGTLVGYAVVRRLGTFGAVDPGWERQGVGTALIDWCEHRQRELRWSEHRTVIPAGNARAEALLAARGYTLVRSNWRMSLTLDDLPRVPQSTGVRMRTLDAGADAAALHRLDEAAFASVAGAERGSLAAFAEEHLQAHDLDESLSRIAERGAEIIGFALTRRWDEERSAFVDLLAVAPREQRRGIGSALLLSVFGAAREAGLREAQLGVSADNPKALKLYERIGMTPRFQLDIYERRVAD